jgi:hypothetical protein
MGYLMSDKSEMKDLLKRLKKGGVSMTDAIKEAMMTIEVD